MKKWLAGLSLSGLLMICAPSVRACTCIIPEVKQALSRADAVFIGKVKEIIEPKKSGTTSSPENRFYTIKFEVEKNWKGAPLPQFSVLSAQGDGCFAYHRVEKGERYLVFADPFYPDEERKTGPSIITACSRTQFSEKATQDMRALDSLTSPIQLWPAKKPNLGALLLMRVPGPPPNLR